MRILIPLGTRCKPAVLLFIMAAVLPAAAQPPQRTRQNSPTLRKAEAAANRIVETFHRTLDFAPAFADQFVTEPGLRARAVAVNDPDQLKGFETPSRERVYVTALTFLHLWAEYMMIQDVNDVPPEVDRMDPKPEWLITSTSKPPRNLEQLNQGILDAEKVSALYRKYFSGEVWHSAKYLESVRSERERAKKYRHNVPRIEKGNRKFGIPETVPVYVVRPEMFDYYFIQEKGVMKLFYVDVLPNFRLF